jgi:hypothetical protein
MILEAVENLIDQTTNKETDNKDFWSKHKKKIYLGSILGSSALLGYKAGIFDDSIGAVKAGLIPIRKSIESSYNKVKI